MRNSPGPERGEIRRPVRGLSFFGFGALPESLLGGALALASAVQRDWGILLGCAEQQTTGKIKMKETLNMAALWNPAAPSWAPVHHWSPIPAGDRVRQADVEIDGIYWTRISGNRTQVKIIAENLRSRTTTRNRHPGWTAENLRTGRRVIIKARQHLFHCSEPWDRSNL